MDGPNTAFSEALRSLRTALLLSRSGSPPKVILVTSPAEGEGKSTVSVNLATVFAQTGSKVLLVEADMRRPGLSRRFLLNSKPGLSNLLSGSTQNAQIKGFSGVESLDVLPAGSIPPYPSELLSSARMRELIRHWSEIYDFILIDSPPALAVTDAAILSRLADVTLLITRYAQSTRKSVERAYKSLQFDELSKVGVVLNGISRKSGSYGEYYGYNGNGYYVAETGAARG